MTRVLTTIATVVLLSFAFAQDTPLVRAFAMVAASEMDATMIDCPVELDSPVACFVHGLGVDWAKMDWESLVRDFSDLTWLAPWELDRAVTSRPLLKTSDPEMYLAVLMMDWETHKALVVVLHAEDTE